MFLNRNVDISDYAFDNSDNVTITSYEGSAAYNYFLRRGRFFNGKWNPLDDVYIVTFLDEDGTPLDTQMVTKNSFAVFGGTLPQRKGETFAGCQPINALPSLEGGS